MAVISQTVFSNAFFWMKIYGFRIRFHWFLFLWAQSTIWQHWFTYWRGADQATSHYLNQWWLLYWCIYVSLGLNELMGVMLSKPQYVFRFDPLWRYPFNAMYPILPQYRELLRAITHLIISANVVTPWHRNALRIIGHLWGKSTSHQRIPIRKDQ